MKTYAILNDNGRSWAFEIENAYIGPRNIASLLAGINSVSHIRKRQLFSPSDDIHLRFRYCDREYIVWEPFGDNSRYWIGPADEMDMSVDVSELITAFEQYRPQFLCKIFGDLVTLKFRSLFRHQS